MRCAFVTLSELKIFNEFGNYLIWNCGHVVSQKVLTCQKGLPRRSSCLINYAWWNSITQMWLWVCQTWCYTFGAMGKQRKEAAQILWRSISCESTRRWCHMQNMWPFHKWNWVLLCILYESYKNSSPVSTCCYIRAGYCHPDVSPQNCRVFH